MRGRVIKFHVHSLTTFNSASVTSCTLIVQLKQKLSKFIVPSGNSTACIPVKREQMNEERKDQKEECLSDKINMEWIDAQKNIKINLLMFKTTHITLAYPCSCFNGILNTQFGHAYCFGSFNQLVQSRVEANICPRF